LELRERLAYAERNNRVDEALARQLALALQENARLPNASPSWKPSSSDGTSGALLRQKLKPQAS
jgi:hypothetical protein